MLPEEVGEPLAGDLEEGFRRRHAERGGLRAGVWYWGQVIRLPYGALARAVGRLRRSRRRSVQSMADGGGRMGRFGEELRIGARTLARRPGFALVVVVTLAASIGAATLIFSALEAVIARTLPYPEGDRVVTLYGLNEAWRDGENAQLRDYWDHYPVSLDQVEAARSTPGLTAIGGAGTGDVVLRTDAGARRVSLASVSEGVFEALGVAPRLGRLPSAEELASGAAVVVVSNRLWTDALARDPDVIGRTLGVDGTPSAVIGVMPEGFFFPTSEQQLWGPLPERLLREGRGLPVLIGVGRVAEGAEIADVSEAVDASARRLGEDDGALGGSGMRAVSRRDEAIGQVQGGLTLFMGAVVLVVVLAAVNLANLVLARASHRRGELAVRRALGGGRVAVAWTVMAEVLLLCVVGGGAGVLAAAVLLHPFMTALAGVDLLRGADAHVNAAVLAFALSTTVLAALGAGLPIAWRASRSRPAAALRAGRRTGASRATRRTQRLLLVTESSLAFVLLAGATLLVRSVAAVAAVDPGYALTGLDFVELRPSTDRYPEREDRIALYASVVREVTRRVGQPATMADPLPSAGTSNVEPIRTKEATDAGEVAATRVGIDFFDVLGLPLLGGRGFTPADGPDAPAVVVVDETLARHLAPGGDALGRAVVVGRGDGERDATIVGVAADARMLAVAIEPQEHLYLPIDQFPTGSVAVLARGAGGGGAATLREAALAVDPDLVLGRMGTLEGASWQVMAPIRARALLLAALAVLAVLLAAVGIFGVVAHVVEERTREIGVRIALGALPAGESLRVTRSFFLTVGAGTLVGLGVALVASRVLESMLYEVRPLDPLSYAAAAVLLPALGALAAWLPARRAAVVDPIQVLNRE
jgi:predicted permease